MISIQYVWLVWSTAFLIPWIILYAVIPSHRKVMLWISLFTMPFGLTEPLFVPEYWSPPSLFNLALTTGFDIESLIFCFGIGGVGVVLYNVITGARFGPVSEAYRRSPLHRHHKLAIATPFIAFPLLYFLSPFIARASPSEIKNGYCRRPSRLQLSFSPSPPPPLFSALFLGFTGS